MRIEVDAREVKEVTLDAQGRVTLGAEYSGETLQVVIVSPSGDDEA